MIADRSARFVILSRSIKLRLVFEIFLSAIIIMFARIKEDVAVVFERDPAARSKLEVLTCYPGIHAVVLHRFNHWFWNHRLKAAKDILV